MLHIYSDACSFEPRSALRLHLVYAHAPGLTAAFMPFFLGFSLGRSVREGTAMDLLYLIGIVAFGGLVAALAIGCDKLHRAPGGRP